MEREGFSRASVPKERKGCSRASVPKEREALADRRAWSARNSCDVGLARMSQTSGDKLPRTLGLWSSVALVVGITIGSGIFRSPAGIAQKVPNPGLMIALWVVGGVVTLCGALSLAEIAAALPQTGGIYAYLREAWGRRAAFLFGWSELVLIRASALGGIAVVFGEYLLRSFGIDPTAHMLAARGLSAGPIVS